MILILIAVGLITGLISSFFGIGGGVIIIPGLSTAFPQLPHAMLIGCSLLVICLNGLVNSFYFYRSGQRPHLKVVAIIGFFMVLGSVTGSRLAVGMDQAMLKKIFAILLYVVFAKTIFHKKKEIHEENPSFDLSPKSIALLVTFGFAGGLLAGLTGVGGGIIIMPLLTTVFSVPYKKVSSYSNPVMAMATLAGSISYFTSPLNTFTPLPKLLAPWQIGHINLLIVGAIVLISALSSPFGVKLSQQVSQTKSKWAFSILVLFMAIKMSMS